MEKLEKIERKDCQALRTYFWLNGALVRLEDLYLVVWRKKMDWVLEELEKLDARKW